MSLENAMFLVNRAGETHHSKGSDIGTNMVAGDSVLVQRGSDIFNATYDGSGWDKIQNDDLLLAWDGNSNRKVTGENFKGLFASSIPEFPDGFGIKTDKESYPGGPPDFVLPVYLNMPDGLTEDDYKEHFTLTPGIHASGDPYFKVYNTNSGSAIYKYTARPSRAVLVRYITLTFTNKLDPSDKHTFESNPFTIS